MVVHVRQVEVSKKNIFCLLGNTFINNKYVCIRSIRVLLGWSSPLILWILINIKEMWKGFTYEDTHDGVDGVAYISVMTRGRRATALGYIVACATCFCACAPSSACRLHHFSKPLEIFNVALSSIYESLNSQSGWNFLFSFAF